VTGFYYHPVFLPVSSGYLYHYKSSRVAYSKIKFCWRFFAKGSLEVILDRKLAQDDWRGLGEGITDNLPAVGQFILLLEPVRKHVAYKVS